MRQTYFELGNRAVKHEQDGKEQAGYGSFIIDKLFYCLTLEFSKGFSKGNLE